MRNGYGWGPLLVACTALAGCGGEPPAPAATEAAGETGPDSPPGITLGEAHVQLPVVAGRPGAAYFTVAQASGAPRAIAAVSVAGAGRAELHETREENGVSRMMRLDRVPLGSGNSVAFEPGGRHVMLFDIDPALRPGGTTELTVSFDNGDKATASAHVMRVGEQSAPKGGEHAH